jgi:hypothetical protein
MRPPAVSSNRKRKAPVPAAAEGPSAKRIVGGQKTLPWPVKFPVPRTWEEYFAFKAGLRRCIDAEKKRQARRREQKKAPLPEYRIPEIQEPAGPRPANHRQMMKDAFMDTEELWRYVDEDPVLVLPELPSASEMPLAEEGLDLFLQEDLPELGSQLQDSGLVQPEEHHEEQPQQQ